MGTHLICAVVTAEFLEHQESICGHGGWSMPFFDEEAMGPVLDEGMAQTEALLFGRRTWEVMAAAWPESAGDAFADVYQFHGIAKRTLFDAA